MFRKFALVCTLVCSVLAFSQFAPKAKYQIANVLEVAQHDTTAGQGSSPLAYEVTVKVGNTIYVVLYTPPLGMQNVKYAAGAEVLVLVGEKTIRYNDIAGNSVEVPILRRQIIAQMVTIK